MFSVQNSELFTSKRDISNKKHFNGPESVPYQMLHSNAFRLNGGYAFMNNQEKTRLIIHG
jgi:hypothetical protein